ncbi:sulfotransferase [Microbulbifer agarilyticus]|uniref:tetratricopeptide repeat-containing sulfotransferase family protein n=1 Tax=Microbulbifer agarilyticus TaxID=260552 RepID=UPI001C93CCCB|nr:sulfotransferase [Microbulbifer agarilyticus]MBY6210035.1 sulfotransferase [Microbulbifer agarilyticus]
MQTAVEPNSEAKQAYIRARQYFRSGNLSAAQSAAEEVIRHSPGFASGRRLYADILMGCNQFAAARDQLDSALQLFPNQVDRRRPILLHKATSFVREGDLAGALGVATSADLKPVEALDAAMLSQLGYLLTLCESHEAALRVFEHALTQQPDDPLFLFNCAAANRAMGNLERAEQLYDRVLALNPQDWEAYKNRSDLRKQNAKRNHIPELQQQLVQRDLPEVARVQLQFALAKEYEDLGQYADSFAALQQGCEVRRKSIDYQIDRDLSVMSDIAARFTSEFLAGCDIPSDFGKEIIFVLGMPRTGSTLLDRVLCASGDVVSAGEPDTFARLLVREAGKVQGAENGSDRNIILQAGEALDVTAVGKAYVQQLYARAQLAGAKRIIDKNPMNFLYLGWIARALPGAKIVHLCRNPMDTCYAVYKTLFKTAYPFSYSQSEMAQYYGAYHRLMQHWRAVFADRVIDVDYESLVTDLPNTGQELYRHCELSWDDAVATGYYKSNKGTATASAAQVHQPVYQTSLKKWRNYVEQLQPMQDILVREGIEFA